jgi:hypothetical protein
VLCPSCKNPIPENSAYCNHCGTQITYSPKSATTPWEYKDFVYTYQPGKHPYRGAQSLVYTRQDVWNEEQWFILPELQKWIDLGWEPITAIGTAGFVWESYKAVDFILLIPTSVQLEKLVEFRVKMRAPKGTQLPFIEDPLKTLINKVENLTLGKNEKDYYQQGCTLIQEKEYNNARLEFAKVLRVSRDKNSKWYKAALARLDEIGY